jgi:hypothetical protein
MAGSTIISNMEKFPPAPEIETLCVKFYLILIAYPLYIAHYGCYVFGSDLCSKSCVPKTFVILEQIIAETKN